MLSHKFRVGAWAKRKPTGKDHMTFLMNSTNAQRSFVHELASQQLGHPPSNMWGVPIPTEFHQPTDTATLNYIMHSAKHAPHEFGRLISSHKKASGWVSGLMEAVGDGVKTAAKYGAQVAKWAGEHSEQIMTGTKIVKGLVQTGTSIAQMTGAMSGESKANLDAIAAALDKHAQATWNPEPKKKGGYFGRILI